MSYVAVVPTIYNNALSGALAGMLSARGITDPTQVDYLSICNAASAYAQELDTTLGADATLASSGATVVPADAAHQNAALTKPALIFGLSKAQFEGRSPGSATPGDYLTSVNAVIAAYKEALTLTSAL